MSGSTGNRRSIVLVPLLAALLLTHPAAAQRTTLVDFLEAAEAYDAGLRDLTGQASILQKDSALARARFGPQVNATGQVLYAPSGSGWGYDQAITNGGLYSAVVGASVPLFRSFERRARTDAVVADRGVLRTDIAATRIEVQRTVTALFLQAHADQRVATLAQQELDLWRSEEQVLAALVDRGIYPQTDLLVLRSGLEARHIAVKRARTRYRADLAQLRIQCGIMDTATVELDPPALQDTVNFDATRSPAMRRFEAERVRNGIADRAIDAAYRPQVDVMGDLGLNAVTAPDIPQHFGGSLGAGLSLPIYDGGQRKLAHDKVAIQEATRQVQADHYALQLEARHARLRAALSDADSLLDDLRAQLERYDALVNIYRTELEQGVLKMNDLFNILNARTALLTDLVQAESDRDQVLNELIHLQ